MFSRRITDVLRPNRIATARATHPPQWDLTVSNPTACGFPYPHDLLQALSQDSSFTYLPQPKGSVEARAAVAREYVRFGAAVDPDRIVLTASTSEAYSFLFKLLCEPGDAVLVPAPSYPLFDHLARLEGVEPIPYHLDPEAGWRLSPAELCEAEERVRAVVVVHPNNPTGSLVHPADAAELRTICQARGWALVADEVFLDFDLDGGPGSGRSLVEGASCLTFCLGGLSKSCGLPQLKASWIAAAGPEAVVSEALERLELMADTYLSVSTPVQNALPFILGRGAVVREAIKARCRGNLALLRSMASEVPEAGVLSPGGGWSAVLRFPRTIDEEALVVELLEHHGVGVFPGFFFDFPYDGVVVASLLPHEESFREGCRRLLLAVASHL